MITRSVWKSGTETTSFETLAGNMEVDVAIIGGGITGITAAYILSKEGKKAVVLEARKIADGSTGYSTGNLYAMVGNQGLHKVSSKWNKDVAKNVVASRAAAINFIEDRVKEFGIECDFKRIPWCLFTGNDEQESYINKERDALKDAGIKLSNEINFPMPAKYGIRVEGQAQFNPYTYVVQLAKNTRSANCSIYENTRFLKLEEGDEICTIQTDKGEVKAAHVIMATHTPKGIYKVHTTLSPFRECAVAVKLKGAYPPPGTYWYLRDSEHYSIRTYDSSEGPVLMVLGENYKVGHSNNVTEKFEVLENFLGNHFDVSEVVYKWAAQQYKPADGIPYIGISSGHKRTYIATGFSADGLTYGTLAANIIADHIMGIENEWYKTYDAARTTPLASAKEFIKETIDVATQYLKDIPGNVDAKDADEIKQGEGKVIQVKGEKLAAYRDTKNNLHVCSAVCTHMDCIVNFNEAERSWDCPCHGSRFNINGEVIEGPAITDLPKRNVKTD